MLNCYTPKPETHKLLDEYHCTVLLYTEYSEDHVPSGAIARKVPSVQELLSDEAVIPVKYAKVYEDVKSDLIGVLSHACVEMEPKRSNS
jgi:hypothetical protein